MRPDETLSPALLKKAVYAGTNAASFARAAHDLETLGEQEISDQRIRRATVKIGNERVAERDAAVERYREMPLPERRQSPVEHIPKVVAVGMDGGRMQIRDRHAPQAGEPVEEAGRKGRFWREMKVGVLETMASQTHAVDPCPTIPEPFVDPARVRRLCSEIKGAAQAESCSEPLDESEAEGETAVFETPDVSATSSATSECSATSSATSECSATKAPDTPAKKRPGLPVPLVRSVVATRHNLEAFGWMLAAAAWARGFAAAARKAFLGDGSESNWSVWRQHFADYTPIVDFVHALCYVYAAAVAGRTVAEAWADYCRWAQWLWSGEVTQVIAALLLRQQVLGLPTASDGEESPRVVLATALGYLQNQQSRMKYAEYRRQGLPITTSHIEATIKQINRRVKGTEKFWSVAGEAILQLCGDTLSDTRPWERFWHNRDYNTTGQRHYQTACWPSSIPTQSSRCTPRSDPMPATWPCAAPGPGRR